MDLRLVCGAWGRVGPTGPDREPDDRYSQENGESQEPRDGTAFAPVQPKTPYDRLIKAESDRAQINERDPAAVDSCQFERMRDDP